MRDFVKLMRRFAAHLTRTRARAGWALTAASLLAYVASGNNEGLRQFWLVLTGVAAGAIFLPERDESIWRMTSAQVRAMVPEYRISALQRLLISARCDSTQWADVVWQRGLEPLLKAGSKAELVIWDAKYDISIHLVERRCGDLDVYRVDTLSRARRALPEATSRKYWVSVARTKEALQVEYQFSNCLTRELVMMPGVDPSAWRAAVAGFCLVRMWVDGVAAPVHVDNSEGLSDVVRWYIDIPEEQQTSTAVPYTLQFDFPIPSDERTFPVLFNGYYSAGASEVTLRIDDPSGTSELSYEHFLAYGLGAYVGEFSRSVDSTHSQQISFATPRDSLLWPGSGIVFHW
ncbi:hypothetical protein [Nocardia iowensis]|uniref:Uncharacterized protein n=1 Tax=Nocardia iowensis TaxID=204891 RepID=A0ABX8RJG9_NOCIO|nr:hypothetical protein [Nocardia iowensis]QXN89778.1 hypothetical protein KV110_30570 [Nocardia iowensis]